jgi:Na+-translocating ferredoxin:NAD+ oxidoreductase subunit E
MKTLTKQDTLQTLQEGLIQKNPILILMLALTPVLGVTSILDHAITLGLQTLVVLVVSTLVLSLVSTKLSEGMYLAVQVSIAALLVTISQMALQVINLALYEEISIYLSLTTLTVVILQRALTTSEPVKPLVATFRNGLYGFGYIVALIILSIVRSVFTTGAVKLFGLQLRIFDVVYSFTLLETAFGSLLFLGLVLGYIRSRKEVK